MNHPGDNASFEEIAAYLEWETAQKAASAAQGAAPAAAQGAAEPEVSVAQGATPDQSSGAQGATEMAPQGGATTDPSIEPQGGEQRADDPSSVPDPAAGRPAVIVDPTFALLHRDHDLPSKVRAAGRRLWVNTVVQRMYQDDDGDTDADTVPVEPPAEPQGGESADRVDDAPTDAIPAAGRPDEAPQGGALIATGDTITAGHDADITTTSEDQTPQGGVSNADDPAAGRPSTTADAPHGGAEVVLGCEVPEPQGGEDEKPAKPKRVYPPKPFVPPTDEEIAAVLRRLSTAAARIRQPMATLADEYRSRFGVACREVNRLTDIAARARTLSEANPMALGPAAFSAAYLDLHEAAGIPVPPEAAADLAAAFAGPAIDSDPALLELRAAEAAVCDGETALHEAMAVMREATGHGSLDADSSASGEAMVVDIPLEVRRGILADLAAMGRHLPHGLTDLSLPLTDVAAARLHAELLAACVQAANDAVDDAAMAATAERQAVGLVLDVRAHIDRVADGLRLNLALLDRLLIDGGWNPIGGPLMEQAQRILAGKLIVPETAGLSADEVIGLPGKLAGADPPRRPKSIRTERPTAFNADNKSLVDAVAARQTAAESDFPVADDHGEEDTP